jgi:hypothetical protein
MVAAADSEDHPSVGQVIGRGKVFGEPQGMPHRRNVEAAAELQAFSHVRQMHTQH